MCTALEKADDATAASLRQAYIAADATTPEGAAAVAKVRQIYGELEIERAYLVRAQRIFAALRQSVGFDIADILCVRRSTKLRNCEN